MSQPAAAPTVAVSDDFLRAYSDLPRPIQRKVRAFLEKFRADPHQGSLHLEGLEGMRDPKVRSARIDLAWRAIVVRPDAGDVYLVVWVDHHDEAVAWARRRVWEIHPQTGALQVLPVDTSVGTARPSAAAPTAARAGLHTAPARGCRRRAARSRP